MFDEHPVGEPLLKVQDLKVWFPVRQGFFESLVSKEQRYVKAVDGVSFTIQRGEVFCLVGESGCGKTTTGKAILRLVEPTGGDVIYGAPPAIMGEYEALRVRFDEILQLRKLAKTSDNGGKAGGPDQFASEVAQIRSRVRQIRNQHGVNFAEKAKMKQLRRRLQIIFQDPYESLNPKMSIYDIVAEPLVVNHLTHSESEKEARVSKALDDAGLRPPKDFMWRYPHEVSGGQRQRVGIAGALVLEPNFLVADEPVSMLDVSIRTEILKLMLDLREKRGLTYLFITHDLSVAWVLSDRIAIMYLGKIVELGPTDTVIKHPQHPYTKSLISVIPVPDPTMIEEKVILKGERPDPTDIPYGCRFHPRCPVAVADCGWEGRDLRDHIERSVPFGTAGHPLNGQVKYLRPRGRNLAIGLTQGANVDAAVKFFTELVEKERAANTPLFQAVENISKSAVQSRTGATRAEVVFAFRRVEEPQLLDLGANHSAACILVRGAG